MLWGEVLHIDGTRDHNWSSVIHRITTQFNAKMFLSVRGDAIKHYTKIPGVISQNYPRQTGTHDHSSYKQVNAKSFKISGI